MMSDAQLLSTLYCLHRKQLYPNYMRGAKLLTQLATELAPTPPNFPVSAYEIQELAIIWRMSQEEVLATIQEAIKRIESYVAAS